MFMVRIDNYFWNLGREYNFHDNRTHENMEIQKTIGWQLL